MNNRSIVSVVGARPHFIKAYPLVNALRNGSWRHIIVHTGQHYSEGMSKVFFDQFKMPEPDYNLNIGSGTHAEQTSRVMLGVEKIVKEVNPAAVVVYGDTNSTLGATLAAAKYYYPVVHIEAGVRCSNRRMPEEINRVLIDHTSDVLACPSRVAVENLRREGIERGVLNIGDFMYDTFLMAASSATTATSIVEAMRLPSKGYYLSTIHREASTRSPLVLLDLLRALARQDLPVVLPLHPRARSMLGAVQTEVDELSNLRIIDPVGYLQMLQLLLHAKKVITDSGGLQKEAYWAGVPCVTLMNETTWVETVEAGWNTLAGTSPEQIATAVARLIPHGNRPEVYGAPGAAQRLVEHMGWN